MVNVDELFNFFRDKKIFITGHTGFKGSWLLATLRETGANIRGYALPPVAGGLFDLIPSNSYYNELADIRDRSRLEESIKNFAPDIVFHLAAQPLVRRSYEVPAETFDVNVTGTANVLESVSKLNNKVVSVIVTTDKVYFNKEIDILYKEDDALGGHDPYSASKACAEFVVDSFRKSFFQPAVEKGRGTKHVVTVRAGNVIGGGDWSKDRIIPDIIGALQKDKPVLVRNPNAIRPWQHVLEAISGYLLLAKKMWESDEECAHSYNLGPEAEDHLPVKSVVETAIEYWGSGSWNVQEVPNAPHEAQILKLDMRKARVELQWRPRLAAKSAIEWTIDWYRQPVEQRFSFTLGQIKQYFAL